MKESALQQTVCEYLSAHGVFYFSIPNEHYNISHAQRTTLKKMGLVPGMPDLAILAHDTIFFMEFKVGKNQLSEKQKIISERLVGMGYEFAVVWSFEDAVVQFLEWGVVSE